MALIPRIRPPGLADKRAFLESGAPWPDDPPPRCIETHASLVFLTTTRVFKLKKPCRLPHADMRSLAARARLCAEELRLNRAMAGEVYRGLVALVQTPEGGLALGGPGRIVDWLVEMARLPASAMLDCRLIQGPPPTAPEITDFGRVMITFYRRQIAPPGAGQTYFTRLAREMATDLAHLHQMRAHLGGALCDSMLARARDALARARPLILARGAAGLVIEGHGDLRAEHVCLIRPPLAFDRVEFDHDFRLIDPHDEMLGLGLDCRLLGADWIGPALSAQLDGAGFPAPCPELAQVYAATRCLTQARLAIDHLRDPNPRTPRKWAPRAQRFLAMATALLAPLG
jgi:uncharacterized protein